MLKLGEKGAISQRDNRTYAVAPHIPCGVVTPQLLRKLADVAEKYGAQALKITGAARIAIVGLKENDIDAVASRKLSYLFFLLKSKDCALDDLRPLSHLLCCKVCTPYPVYLFPVLFSVFF